MTEDSGTAREAVRDPYAAISEERVGILLRFIEEHPQQVLHLDNHNELHTALDEVDLSRETLSELVRSAKGPCAWWDLKQKGVNLENANLQNASLRHANLRGANLRGANLQNAILAGADLRDAMLERANLSGADLAGTRFDDAVLSGANFEGAMLEDTVFANTILRFVDFQDCILESVNLQRADLWGANLERADLIRANLQGATLMEARLAAANLERVNLQNAELGGADLQGANLRGAQLSGATLRNAKLERASLKEAELQRVDLSQSNIRHARFSGADMEKTRFRLEQLGGAIGEELAGEYEEARLGYLALERNFSERGETEAESWAYRKKRRMGKRELLQRARIARTEHQWRRWLGYYLNYLSDLLIEWTCDYGESITRVAATILALWLLFALIYGLTGSIVSTVDNGGGQVKVPVRNPLHVAIFSLYAMTTSGSMPFGMEPRNAVVQLLDGVEGLLAVALTGLLGFVTGNRIRR